MKLTRMRLVGFKSFVEPAEIAIEPGLTGVVGPNGCGKSNLVEALRWVMGESSHKNMRASGMEDVIFAGSGARPARNSAEVLLVIDNAGRRAPAAFNDADTLEVLRRIERDEGSLYRINGREVRARDVQILFADAATGARSPALVRQGQIGEIIAAKPQARRRILEDAAGVAGLHARRHEAELRLKAADDNILRVEDVLREIETQIEALRRQSRQAGRYRAVSAEIRRLEAVLLAIGYAQARAELSAAEAQAAADLAALADRGRAQAGAARDQAVAAEAMPKARQAEAAAAAALQRLIHARGEIEAEARRAADRLAELDRRARDLARDLAHQESVRSDAAATLARLGEEEATLAQAAASADAAAPASAAGLHEAEAELAQAEAALATLVTASAELNARRAALERARKDEEGRNARFAAERLRLEGELAGLGAGQPGRGIDALRAERATAEALLRQAEARASDARAALSAARQAEARAAAPLAEAERAVQRLDTEARTLAKLFARPPGESLAPVLDAVTVERGFEAALAAALGDDLEASADPAAAVHWIATDGSDDPPLPEGALPLSERVRAPPALARRLRQIGVVARDRGEALRRRLRPGQELVSEHGDVWRWDGFTAAAEAPSRAARRLAEKNRLSEIERKAAAARAEAQALRGEAELAGEALREATTAEAAALDLVREARLAFDLARDRLAAAERREAELLARRAALQEALMRVAASAAEAAARAREAEAALAVLAPATALEADLAAARLRVGASRLGVAEARSAHQALLREAEAAGRRRAAIAGEIASWEERARRAAGAAADLAGRLDATRIECETLRAAPDAFVLRRRALAAEIDRAESARRTAADRLAEAERDLAVADQAARAALEALAQAREARAGSQARQEAMAQRLADLVRTIAETLSARPDELAGLAGLKPGAALPDAAAAETRLHQLRGERERLGAVNLRAEEELAELEVKRDGLVGERDDLVEAVKRLRQAIASLNREGRERLLAAFAVVNGHFQALFATLFGGGTAELALVDSDDPLEAGLDILARPPGKKPQTMTLLSGGEQALTAIALIFAVFLTNPSPICVLDEVDAPLDDANVERYCHLLHDMARQTETRFVVITHNPITMARMDRLYGVTMAERGVSQLVSVALGEVEQLRQAV